MPSIVERCKGDQDTGIQIVPLAQLPSSLTRAIETAADRLDTTPKQLVALTHLWVIGVLQYVVALYDTNSITVDPQVYLGRENVRAMQKRIVSKAGKANSRKRARERRRGTPVTEEEWAGRAAALDLTVVSYFTLFHFAKLIYARAHLFDGVEIGGHGGGGCQALANHNDELFSMGKAYYTKIDRYRHNIENGDDPHVECVIGSGYCQDRLVVGAYLVLRGLTHADFQIICIEYVPGFCSVAENMLDYAAELIPELRACLRIECCDLMRISREDIFGDGDRAWLPSTVAAITSTAAVNSAFSAKLLALSLAMKRECVLLIDRDSNESNLEELVADIAYTEFDFLDSISKSTLFAQTRVNSGEAGKVNGRRDIFEVRLVHHATRAFVGPAYCDGVFTALTRIVEGSWNIAMADQKIRSHLMAAITADIRSGRSLSYTYKNDKIGRAWTWTQQELTTLGWLRVVIVRNGSHTMNALDDTHFHNCFLDFLNNLKMADIERCTLMEGQQSPRIAFEAGNTQHHRPVDGRTAAKIEKLAATVRDHVRLSQNDDAGDITDLPWSQNTLSFSQLSEKEDDDDDEEEEDDIRSQRSSIFDDDDDNCIPDDDDDDDDGDDDDDDDDIPPSKQPTRACRSTTVTQRVDGADNQSMQRRPSTSTSSASTSSVRFAELIDIVNTDRDEDHDECDL